MYRIQTLPVVLAFVFLHALPARADTVILEDGTAIEGTVLVETEDAVVVEVPVTETITDRKTFPKSEVREIRRKAADVVAWEELSGIQPPATSFDASDYADPVKRLEDFVKTYPESGFADEARELLDSLRAERDRVRAGDVKLDGVWIEAAEVAERREELEARRLLVAMRRQAANGELIGAMNRFARIEEAHAGQPAYPEAVELARSVANRLNAALPDLRAGLARYQREFEQGFAITPDHEKPALKAAADKRLAEYDALIERAREAGAYFPPLLPRSEKSLDALEKTLDSELPRLEAIDTVAMRRSIELTRQALGQIAEGDIEEATASLDQAEELWKGNALIENARTRIETAEAEAEEKAEAMAEAGAQSEAAGDPGQAAATPTPTPTPTPATPEPSPTPAPGADANFLLTVPGAITVVAVLAVLLGSVTLLSKMSHRGKPQADDEK